MTSCWDGEQAAGLSAFRFAVSSSPSWVRIELESCTIYHSMVKFIKRNSLKSLNPLFLLRHQTIMDIDTQHPFEYILHPRLLFI